MKEFIKKSDLLKFIVKSFRILKNKQNIFKKLLLLVIYYKDFLFYRINNKNNNFSLSSGNIHPCIFDKTTNTPIGTVYFYQDTWCAKKIFDNKPRHHYDVGSMAELVGIISQFVPTTMIDIRPIGLKLNNLDFIEGDVKKLPFKNQEIESLSSMCVVEHIGLGRYGDEFDDFGSEKAISELIRVLAKGGHLYISVPIDSENKIYFNAHRAFSRDYLLKLFNELTLEEEKYIYGDNLENNYNSIKGFGTGLYHFSRK